VVWMGSKICQTFSPCCGRSPSLSTLIPWLLGQQACALPQLARGVYQLPVAEQNGWNPSSPASSASMALRPPKTPACVHDVVMTASYQGQCGEQQAPLTVGAAPREQLLLLHIKRDTVRMGPIPSAPVKTAPKPITPAKMSTSAEALPLRRTARVTRSTPMRDDPKQPAVVS